jgi:hypothetical protein
VCQLIPHAAIAKDIASVRPLRSASSDSSAVPAWDTRFFPSTVTLIDWVARLSCTFKEPSSAVGIARSATCILAAGEGSYADADTAESGLGRIFEASHEVATTPGVHPVLVDKRKLRKVDLFHFSWSRIHTEALIEQTNNMVSDPDQAWILAEFVRYLENSKSGAWDFDDMGPNWVEVRNAAAQQTLRANDKETLEVVARFDQLLAFSGMDLSRQLGVNVQQRLTRKERSDQAARIQDQAVLLARTGQLAGSLVVPNAAAPIDILVDLRANRLDCTTVLPAPTEGRTSTRINWLLRQLKDAPDDLLIIATSARAKDSGPCHSLAALREDPMRLVENPQADIRSFTMTLNHAAGTKRGQGRGSFVESVTNLVNRFYADVMLSLKVWAPPPPRPKQAPQADAQEVEPPRPSEPHQVVEDDQTGSLAPTSVDMDIEVVDQAPGLVGEHSTPIT